MGAGGAEDTKVWGGSGVQGKGWSGARGKGWRQKALGLALSTWTSISEQAVLLSLSHQCCPEEGLKM